MSDYEPDDETERALFRALREHADDAAREVYADWLEQHGHADRAAYLRKRELIQLSTSIDVRWKAAVAAARVSRCTSRAVTDALDGRGCHMTWDSLDRTADDRVRHCTRCAKPVHFCSTLEEAAAHGQRRECIAVDRAMVLGDALHEYDHHATPSVDWVGDFAEPMEPPGPPQPAVDWVGSVAVETGPPPPFPSIVRTPPAPRPGLLERVRGWFRKR